MMVPSAIISKMSYVRSIGWRGRCYQRTVDLSLLMRKISIPNRVFLLDNCNYRPDSDLFVIYTVGLQFASLVAANPAQFTQNLFAIKYTYS